MAMRISGLTTAFGLAMGMSGGAIAADPPQRLDGETVRTAITGRTVQLETPVGTIPITFRPDGTMIGRTADMANWLGRSMDQGVWWIADDRLCQRWKLWLDAKPYCFVLRQVGEKVRWTRNDGLEGTISVRQ